MNVNSANAQIYYKYVFSETWRVVHPWEKTILFFWCQKEKILENANLYHYVNILFR
jgi:hypothetical protein